MHLTAVLSGGATGQGGLAVPLLITGNMAHPNVALDAAEMAKLKLNGLGGAAKGVLGGLLGGQQPTSADGKAKKPANPLGSILDQLGKKKQ